MLSTETYFKRLKQTNPAQASKRIERVAMAEWEICRSKKQKYIICSRGFTDELKLRDAIKLRTGGYSEIKVSTGRIDLLTSDELIEVKNVKGWKDGVGQLLVYGTDFPEKELRLHLFGKCEVELLKTIIEKCAKFHIYVSWKLSWFDIRCKKELEEQTERMYENLSELDDCWDYPESPYSSDFWQDETKL